MTRERVPAGWRAATYSNVLIEQDERAGDRLDIPVLSVTKTRGLMLASERFGKALHSRDLSRYRVARRDAIVADPMLLWDGAIGIQRVVDVGIVSPDYRVYASGDDADPAFMAYVVRSPTMLIHYQGGARGTNVRRNRIARTDFQGIPLAVPPLAEQRKIVEILSAVDDAIEGAQAVIDQLQVVKKAMMAELLTRGLPGRHTRFKQTEIGEVPEGWDVVLVSDCLREPIRNGYSPVCLSAPTGRWILHLGAVTFDGFNELAIKHAPLDDPKIDSTALEPGDLLVSRSNTRDRVGLAGVYVGNPAPCFYPDLLMRVRANDAVLPEFLEAVLLGQRGRSHFVRCARGTSESMVKINREILENFRFARPPMQEQEHIVNCLGSVTDRRRSEVKSLDSLQGLKSALMSVLLTGEVRVTPDEATP